MQQDTTSGSRFHTFKKMTHILEHIYFFIKKVAKVVPGFYNFGPLRIFLHCTNAFLKIVAFMSNFGPQCDLKKYAVTPGHELVKNKHKHWFTASKQVHSK